MSQCSLRRTRSRSERPSFYHLRSSGRTGKQPRHPLGAANAATRFLACTSKLTARNPAYDALLVAFKQLQDGAKEAVAVAGNALAARFSAAKIYLYAFGERDSHLAAPPPHHTAMSAPTGFNELQDENLR